MERLQTFRYTRLLAGWNYGEMDTRSPTWIVADHCWDRWWYSERKDCKEKKETDI